MDRPTQVASVFAAIGADLSGFNRGLSRARQDLGGFSGFMQKSGQNLSKAGRNMMMGITAPLVGIGAKVLSEAAKFESGAALMEMSAKDAGIPMGSLRELAIGVGADTGLMGIDASQAAEGITELFKAGRTAPEVFGDWQGYLRGTTELSGDLRAAVDLQAASELDLATASGLVATAQSVWSDQNVTAMGIADNLVKTADASLASVSDLAQAYGTAGPTLASFNWSIEDTNTALALLSDRGIRGAEAGTGLRSMMTNLQRDTDKVTGAYDELGVALYDQEGTMKRMPDFIGELSRSLEGLTEEQRNQYIQTLAGTYGQNILNALLAANAEGWEKMEGKIEGASSAQEVAAKRSETLEAKTDNLKGAFETFMIYAGTPFIDKFAVPAVEKMTGLVDVMNEMDVEELEKLGKTLAGIAAAPVALFVLGKLVGIVGALGVAGSLLAASGLGVGFAMWLQTDASNALKGALYDLADTNPKVKALLDTLEKFSGIILDIQERGLLGFIKERILGPGAFAERREESRAAMIAASGRGPGAKLLIPPPFDPAAGLPGEGPSISAFPKMLTPSIDTERAGREAAASFVWGAQDFLGFLPAVGEVGGGRGFQVPAGVSPREEQIREAGLKAGRIYGEAFQEAADALMGGLLGTSFLAAARARGMR